MLTPLPHVQLISMAESSSNGRTLSVDESAHFNDTEEKKETEVLVNDKEQAELVQKVLNDALLATGMNDLHIDEDDLEDNDQDISICHPPLSNVRTFYCCIAYNSFSLTHTCTQASSLSQTVKTKWLNITNIFPGSAKKLVPGELIHEATFSLFDAMSAIELTDTKMDAIVQWDRLPSYYPRSLREAIEKGHLKLEGHSPAELIGIFDEILACVATWLRGHTLAQTVFTCMYLLDTQQSENLFLRAFSVAVIKIVDFLREMIGKGGVYAEDEQQLVCIGFNMLTSIKDDTVFATLKAAKDRITTLLKNPISNELNSPSNMVAESPPSITSRLAEEWDRPLTEALLSRIKFIRSLFLLISNLSKKTRESIHASEQELPLCLALLKNIVSTLHLGKPLDLAHPLDLGFHPLINQHLLPPSYRPYSVTSREEAMDLFNSILTHLHSIYRIGRLNNLNSLFSAVLNLSTVSESPNVLVRSLVAQLCLNNDRTKIFGSKSLEAMIKDEVRGLFNPPSLNPRSPVSSTVLVQDIIDRFLGNIHLPFVELLRVYCQHRARQRIMISRYLDTVSEIQQESESVDEQLHKLTQQLDPQRQHLSCYCTWFVYYVSQLFIDYIVLGFEYNLYSPFEMHYIFWYLEYSYGWQQMTLKTAAKLLSQEPQTQAKNKKKLKGKKRELPREREVEISLLNVKRGICIGLMRAYEALLLDDKIPQPNFEFGSEALIFRNRFLPFASVATPQPLTYADYRQLAGIENYKGSGLNLYEAASRHFLTAKASLSALSVHNEDTEQLLKVIKTNIVIMNLAATGHKKDSKAPPILDFSLHRAFPVIRIN